jgi:hypothetical protein
VEECSQVEEVVERQGLLEEGHLREDVMEGVYWGEWLQVEEKVMWKHVEVEVEKW